MQAPQILGIVIGLSLICLGWFFSRSLRRFQKHTAGGILFAIFAYIGILSVLQNAIFSYAPTWNWQGVFTVWAGFLGKAIVPIILAFLGLLYRSNKVGGYIAALIGCTMLMIAGSS